MGKPRNTRHTQKYLKYLEMPEIEIDTRKYPIVYFDTPTDPNPTRYPVFCPIPDPTRPDIEKPYPLGTALKVNEGYFFVCIFSLNYPMSA